MNYTKLYDMLVARPLTHYERLKPGDRIAILGRGGIEELDVMKIRSIGQSAVAPNDDRIAVAYLCPGQLSFRVRKDGGAYLNRLSDPSLAAQYAPSTDARRPHASLNPSAKGTKAVVDPTKDVLLNGPGEKYWVALAGRRIVKLSRDEMRTLQGLVEDPPA